METLAWPSHSCTLAISASFESPFAAVVARIECTHNPTTSASMPVLAPVFHDDVAAYGAGLNVFIQCAGAVVYHRLEEGSVKAFRGSPQAMFPRFQIVTYEPQHHRMHRYEPDFVALALDTKCVMPWRLCMSRSRRRQSSSRRIP